MKFDEKWIVSVACGRSQEPLLKAAKLLGYSIIGIDKGASSDLVDIPIQLSTYATQDVLSEITSNSYPLFDGVLCRSSGPALLTANALSEIYSLPCCGRLVAECSISKLLLHEYLIKLGVSTIPTFSSDIEALDLSGWEHVVIKPAEPQFGKKNVYLVSDDLGCSSYLKAASAESMNGLAIVQPFIKGIDVGLVTLTRGGVVVWHSFFLEINEWEDRRKVCARGVSSLDGLLSRNQEDYAISSARKVISDCKSTGFVFFSFRVTNEQAPMLYEINPGLCGDLVADTLLPALFSSTNFFEIDVLTMTGQIACLPHLPSRRARIINGLLSAYS